MSIAGTEADGIQERKPTGQRDDLLGGGSAGRGNLVGKRRVLGEHVAEGPVLRRGAPASSSGAS